MPEYSVPQFIEDESKIIFFLTFRQFFILVGGGLLCFFSYILLPFNIFVIVGALIAILTGVIGFLKIQGDSVVKIALNFIGFSFGSKNYTWKKGGNTPEASPNITMENYQKPNFRPQEYIKKTSPTQKSKLKGIKTNIELKKEI